MTKDIFKEYFEELMEWKNCAKCKIGTFAFKHVMFDTIPKRKHRVDVLFVGEGPGRAENTIGRPFIGPAGRLLRGAIDIANENYGLIIGLTNLVACRPCDDINSTNRAPKELEVSNCKDRLLLTIKFLRPKAIVALGLVPAHHLEQLEVELDYHLYHPAYILRTGGENSAMYPGYVSAIKTVFLAVKEGKDAEDKEEESLTRTRESRSFPVLESIRTRSN